MIAPRFSHEMLVGLGSAERRPIGHNAERLGAVSASPQKSPFATAQGLTKMVPVSTDSVSRNTVMAPVGIGWPRDGSRVEHLFPTHGVGSRCNRRRICLSVAVVRASFNCSMVRNRTTPGTTSGGKRRNPRSQTARIFRCYPRNRFVDRLANRSIRAAVWLF